MIELQLVDWRDETDRIRVMEFASAIESELPAFTPGAHIEFDLLGHGSRAYSLINWDAQKSHGDKDKTHKLYRIAVQREDDGLGGSKAMHALQIGQTLQASQPINNFELSERDAPVILLAGGIGITPLISMATQLSSAKRAFTLHYSARSEGAMGFRDELASAFSQQVHFYFDDSRPIDLSAILSTQSAQKELYICGPKGMIEAAKAEAIKAGLSEHNIHVELFTSPATDSADTPFEVEINDTGEVFTIPVGQSIIDVLEAAGKDLMYDCQRGDCGICQTDVVSGTPDHRDVVLSEADRASGKVMQICVSRALSARLVLDL